MADNILVEIKDLANVEAADEAFDGQIKLYINSAFSTLNQLGIGPTLGFRIAGADEEWSAFLDEGPLLDKAKEYIALKVRYEWDAPGTGYHTTALKELIAEAEWRLSIMREETDWVPPDPPPADPPLELWDPFGP